MTLPKEVAQVQSQWTVPMDSPNGHCQWTGAWTLSKEGAFFRSPGFRGEGQIWGGAASGRWRLRCKEFPLQQIAWTGPTSGSRTGDPGLGCFRTRRATGSIRAEGPRSVRDGSDRVWPGIWITGPTLVVSPKDGVGGGDRHGCPRSSRYTRTIARFETLVQSRDGVQSPKSPLPAPSELTAGNG